MSGLCFMAQSRLTLSPILPMWSRLQLDFFKEFDRVFCTHFRVLLEIFICFAVKERVFRLIDC